MGLLGKVIVTAVPIPRDFVEFPSQVYEMWATWPEVLENYAIHYKTNEPPYSMDANLLHTSYKFSIFTEIIALSIELILVELI